jgi:transcriptional regulator with XRE-family HTH domain
MSFTEQLKSEIARLGLTQAEAAAILDVSPRAIWKWLHGDSPLAVTQEGVLARLKDSKPSTAAVLADNARLRKKFPPKSKL